jgi:uncharacterized protein (DUF1778 family)
MLNRRVGKAMSPARGRRRKACSPHPVLVGTARGRVADLPVRSRPAPAGAARPPPLGADSIEVSANGRTLYSTHQRVKKMVGSAKKITRSRERAERLETRVTADQKSLIERAAALQGRSVTDFVLASVQEAARRAIEEHQRLGLSLRDSRAFVEALVSPAPVNSRLRETVRRYREKTGLCHERHLRGESLSAQRSTRQN